MWGYDLQYSLVLVIMVITIFNCYYFLESVKFSIIYNKGQVQKAHRCVMLVAHGYGTDVNMESEAGLWRTESCPPA